MSSAVRIEWLMKREVRAKIMEVLGSRSRRTLWATIGALVFTVSAVRAIGGFWTKEGCHWLRFSLDPFDCCEICWWRQGWKQEQGCCLGDICLSLFDFKNGAFSLYIFPHPLTPCNHWSFCCLHNCAFSRKANSWNHSMQPFYTGFFYFLIFT